MVIPSFLHVIVIHSLEQRGRERLLDYAERDEAGTIERFAIAFALRSHATAVADACDPCVRVYSNCCSDDPSSSCDPVRSSGLAPTADKAGRG